MSCKKPILLAIDGVSRTLVESANCGFYAEPENVKAIEKAVNQALSTKNLYLIGENGYIFAMNEFNRKKLAHDYINYISEVVTH